MKTSIYREWRKNNPNYWARWARSTRGKDLVKRTRLRLYYNITPEQHDAMHVQQNGACAICRKTGGWKANGGSLVVDHCHDSKQVRGLLCPSCNRGLGQFEDNPAVLENAIHYLTRSRILL